MEENRQPKINSCLHGQMIFQQSCQDHSKRKECSFQQTVLEKEDIHMQKNEVGPFPYTIYKINSKCIQDIKVRPKI